MNKTPSEPPTKDIPVLPSVEIEKLKYPTAEQVMAWYRKQPTKFAPEGTPGGRFAIYDWEAIVKYAQTPIK